MCMPKIESRNLVPFFNVSANNRKSKFGTLFRNTFLLSVGKPCLVTPPGGAIDRLGCLLWVLCRGPLLRRTLGFAVLRFWSLLRSVFRVLRSKSPVLVSAAGFRFFPFWHSGFGFYEQKSGYSVLASNSRIVRTFLSSLQKFHLHMRRRQWNKRLLWLNIAKIFFGIMRIKFALQAV